MVIRTNLGSLGSKIGSHFLKKPNRLWLTVFNSYNYPANREEQSPFDIPR